MKPIEATIPANDINGGIREDYSHESNERTTSKGGIISEKDKIDLITMEVLENVIFLLF